MNDETFTGKNLEVKVNEKGEVINETSMFSSGFDVDLQKAAEEKVAAKAAAKEEKKKKKKEKEVAKAAKEKTPKNKVRVFQSEDPFNGLDSMEDASPAETPVVEETSVVEEPEVEETSEVEEEKQNLPWDN